MVTIKCTYGDIVVFVKEARIDISLVYASRRHLVHPISTGCFRA